MEMFNKLKSVVGSSVSNTITSTVYSTGNMISGVLPGNPVTREYEVNNGPVDFTLIVSLECSKSFEEPCTTL